MGMKPNKFIKFLSYLFVDDNCNSLDIYSVSMRPLFLSILQLIYFLIFRRLAFCCGEMMVRKWQYFED